MNRSTREIERDVERTRSDIEDTVEALRDKMSLGQIVDEAAHYWRGHGGDEVVSNLAAQARANPLPLALVGIGLAWLMSGRGQPAMSFSSGSSYGGRSGSYGTGSSYPGGSSYAGGTAYGGSGGYESGSTSSSGIGSRVGDAASSISETGRKAGEAVSSGMQKVGDTASQAYGRVSDTASQTYDRVTGSASHAYERVSDTAANTYDRMADRAGRMQRNMSDLIESEPLILAGLGLAVGAAIGAMMPATRAENRLMGETLEEWKHDASEMARDEWEKTKSVAKDAIAAAKTEVEKGGPLGETAERAAKSAASTAEQSASDKGLGGSVRKS